MSHSLPGEARTAGPRAARFSASILLAWAAVVVAAPTVDAQPPVPKAPAQPGKADDVPELRLRWEAEVKDAPNSGFPQFDLEGKYLVIRCPKYEAVTLDTRTGAAGPSLPSVKMSGDVRSVIPLEKGKLAFRPYRNDREYLLWDTTSGKTTRFPTPDVQGGAFQNMSPSGRYLTVARSPSIPPEKSFTSPLRVIDTRTGKAVLSLDWMPGQTLYTADSSRVLVVDATDRFQWFRLPSGKADGEWKHDLEPNGLHAQVHSMSADGGVLLYSGVPPKKPRGLYLIDGKTGAVLHSFPPRTYGNGGFVSPDGRKVVLLRTDGFGPGHGVELLDSRGTLLARVKVPRAWAFVVVSWEARAVGMYESDSKRAWVYDLPGAFASAVPRPGARDESAKARDPVPGDAAAAKAEAVVRQVLKAEYARKQPAERKALAQRLITLAGETADDPAARYVMLRDAMNLAVELGDPALALEAVGGLADSYQVDGPTQTLAALEKILASTSNPAAVRLVAESAGPAADAAAAADEFDEAVQFAQLAAAAARKGKPGPGAVEEADYRLARAKKGRDSFAAVRPAVEKLAANPDDREANTALGKYRCFVQGRWDEGLRHLARGSNGALRDLADIDLKAPRTGVPDIQVADSWWEYAQAAPADEQWGAQTRTRYWYGRCLAGLTGLNKVKAENRLAFTAGGVEYRPGLVCEFTARQPAVLKGKRARIDPVIDFSGGEFWDGAKVTDLTVKWTGVLTPPLAGRYELGVSATDPVRVRVDNRLVIDTVSGKGGKTETAVVLGERPVPVVVEFFAPNTERHKIKLVWRPPGASGDELIPAEYLFHDRKTESVLGK